MKAAYIEKTGPADVIQYGELPKPQAGGSQVLVKTGAVAVNPIDTYIRGGAPYWQLPVPFIIGCDLAGTVEEVGPQVKRFKKGDRVWCSSQGLQGRQGTFAEYCAVDENWIYPTPAGVSDDAVAASALVGTWGSDSARFGEATASAFSVPAFSRPTIAGSGKT